MCRTRYQTLYTKFILYLLSIGRLRHITSFSKSDIAEITLVR